MNRARSADKILDATLGVIVAEGPDAASLRRIGSAAGLHNSSLFHHYPSKQAIHDALAERTIAAARDRLVPPLAGDPPRIEGLLAGLGDLAEHLAAHPEEASYLAHALLGGTAGAFAHARERVGDALLRPIWEWLRRARDAGEIRPVRPQPATLQLMGLVLLEPAYSGSLRGAGLRPASRARRREVEAWVRATLARR